MDINIENIEWEKLNTAYGPAKDIPEKLYALRTASIPEAINLIFDLNITIFHQDTFYSATPYVIAILTEYLNDQNCLCKARILEFIAEVANIASLILRESDQSNDYINLCKATFDTIAEVKSLLPTLLIDNNSSIRTVTAYLICSITIYIREENLVAILMSRLPDEEDELVKASLIFAIGELAPVYALDITILDHYYSSGKIPIRIAAMLALIKSEETIRTSFVRMLNEVLLDYTSFYNLFLTAANYQDTEFHPMHHLFNYPDDEAINLHSDAAYFPWRSHLSISKLLTYAVEIPYAELDHIKPGFLHIVSQATGYTIQQRAFLILKYILRMEGQSQFPLNDLSTVQREFLTVLHENIYVWADFDSGSSRFVMENLGLPLHRKEWRQFLEIDELPVSSDVAEETVRRLVNKRRTPDRILTHDDYLNQKTLSLQFIANDLFLPEIQKFTNLVELDISNSDISGKTITYMPIWSNLKQFYLSGIHLEEEAVVHISKLDTLERLGLVRTNFQMDWLKHLTSLNKLQYLFLAHNGLSNTDIQYLQEHLPNCKIYV